MLKDLLVPPSWPSNSKLLFSTSPVTEIVVAAESLSADPALPVIVPITLPCTLPLKVLDKI